MSEREPDPQPQRTDAQEEEVGKEEGTTESETEQQRDEGEEEDSFATTPTWLESVVSAASHGFSHAESASEQSNDVNSNSKEKQDRKTNENASIQGLKGRADDTLLNSVASDDAEDDELSMVSALAGEPEVTVPALERRQASGVSLPGAFAITPSTNNSRATVSSRAGEMSITPSEQESNNLQLLEEQVPQTSLQFFETTGELVLEADPVSDNTRQVSQGHPDMPAVVGTAIDEARKSRRRKRSIAILIAISIVAVVAVITSVVLALRGRGDDEEDEDSTTTLPDRIPTAVPTSFPTPIPESKIRMSMIQETLNATGDIDVPNILETGESDPTLSSQRQALIWMLEEDTLTLNTFPELYRGRPRVSPEIQLLERYALLVVYYALAGTASVTRFLDQFSDTCAWNFNNGSVGVICDDNARVGIIRLGRKEFDGTFPTEIGFLKRLQVVTVNQNKIHGTLPPEMFVGMRLNSLFIFENEISGSIPSEIGEVSDTFTIIDSAYNRLTGSLPTEILLLTNLRVLQIRNSPLSGTLPAGISVWSQLQFIDITSNGLSGSLPTELGLLTNLEYLKAPANKFTGSLPSELGGLKRLQLLEFTLNKLVGSIPTTIGLITGLSGIHLHDNPGLTGSLPSELGSLPLVEFLAGNNSIVGSVPNTYRNLSRLGKFIMFHTRLTGSVDDIFCTLEVEHPLEELIFDYCNDGIFIPSNVTCSCCTQCGASRNSEPIENNN